MKLLEQYRAACEVRPLAKAWYLFAGVQDTAIVAAILQGKQSPTVAFFGLDADPRGNEPRNRVFNAR